MNADPTLLRQELGYTILYLVISIPVLILYLWVSKKARKEWKVLMGQIKPKETYGWERRRYIRLDSIFPIEFRKIEGDKLGALYEGFTKDISRNGICLEVKALHGKQIENLVPGQTKLRLTINMPLHAEPIEAIGVVKWIQKLEGPSVDKYSMGIFYDNIKDTDASHIIKYSLWLYRKPIFFASFTILLVLIIAGLSTFISSLGTTKVELQRQMKDSFQEKKVLVHRIKKSEREKEELGKKLELMLEDDIRKNSTISDFDTKDVSDKKSSLQEKEHLALESELKRIMKEKEELRERLYELEESEEIEEEEGEFEPEEFPEETSQIEAEIIEEEDAGEYLITDEMLEEETHTYSKFRDYILGENIQLLDRYCYQHKSSIYHAASIFALAELRYKHRQGWELVENAYEEVIKRYPMSKYATYASYRIDQIKKRLPYEVYTLKYFYTVYSPPPLLDYRDIEPYRR